MSETPPPIIHARNPAWNGPLCRYKMGAIQHANQFGHSIYFHLTKRPDNSNVTCQNCLYKLGKLPKREMPNLFRGDRIKSFG